MKRCPQCHRVETDELLKFCRVDGVPLVEDVESGDESSATRILPTPSTGEAPLVHTAWGDAQVTTTRLEPAKEPKREKDERVVGRDQAHWIAKIYAALNEKDLAFSWLERGLSTGAVGTFYKDEPVWAPIRNDQRFADLLRRMGITL